jgi:hypothetical protein
MLMQAIRIFWAGTAEIPSFARKCIPSQRPAVPRDLFSEIAIMNSAPAINQLHNLSDFAMRYGPTVIHTGSSVYTNKKKRRTLSEPTAAAAFLRACSAQ